jgi:exodeoxyribonuclease VII large subunit
MKESYIYTIAELNSQARLLLEEGLGSVCVMGEMSNLAKPASGHMYFTLKDKNAQVRCALFRMNRRRVDFTPENGQQVMARATVSIYEGRGDYQLIISEMQLAGSGALQVAFEKLKKKLQAEGLFDESIKQPIPHNPSCIGVITSATGAAIRDILKVLRRRSPSTRVIIYPTLVQGNDAKQQIVTAIEKANMRQECDALIVSRGGGSLEDLWPFNEECVARAIFASQLPIVSGVGHEVDFTIADFVADHRAATPSAAAEFISADQRALLQELKHSEQRLTRFIYNLLQYYQSQITHLQKRLRHPRDKLREQAQTIDQLEQQLILLMQNRLLQSKSLLTNLASKLDALSPLSTLKRGYAIVSNDKQKTIDSIKQVKSGDNLNLQLSDGTIKTKVLSTQH